MWCTSTRLVAATHAREPAFVLSAPDTRRADRLLTWGGRLLLVFSCSLLSELQIRPQRNLIRWVSKCRQPDGFYGDSTCCPLDHFPLKKMHQQHSFMSDRNKKDCSSPTTVAYNILMHTIQPSRLLMCLFFISEAQIYPNFIILD